jgi:hypothetical protein
MTPPPATRKAPIEIRTADESSTPNVLRTEYPELRAILATESLLSLNIR